MISIDSESSLLCPLCKGNLLHHKRVEVFERNAEESKSGSHVVVDLFTDYKPEISVTPSMRGNPSGRRGAILINFWCETCRQTSVLKISQHKGQTFNRHNQYANEITEESDQSLINRYGSRIEDPQDWNFIHTLQAATFAANMRLKHGTYIRNTYEFTLPFIYSYVEPMDIVTLTTSSVWAQGVNNTNLGVTNLPVRITKVVDDPTEGLKIEAEDYPFGAGCPTLFNKGISTGTIVSNPYASPGTSEVVLFEAAGRLVGYGGNQIWMGASGTGANYGSTNVWVSQDGTNYVQVATMDTPSTIGELSAIFPTGTDPDTTHSLVVKLAENCPALASGSTEAADNDTMLCFVDGEVISYSACAVTGQNTYTMGTYIRRGQLGTTISAHSIGSLFMRLDASVVKYTYDPTWQGKTIYFKFQAVNNFGNNPQPLSNLTPVTFTIGDTNSGVVDASTGLILTTSLTYPGGTPAPPVVIISQSATNTSGSGGSISASDGVTVTSSGGLTTTAKIWLTISWTWPSTYPTPTGFNVVAFTGSDPTVVTNYLFDIITVGPTTLSTTIAVTPTSSMSVVNAAVEAVYSA